VGVGVDSTPGVGVSLLGLGVVPPLAAGKQS
jgi:hypothetical protein